MDLNKVMLIGRSTSTLQVKTIESTQSAVVNFTLATNRKYKNAVHFCPACLHIITKTGATIIVGRADDKYKLGSIPNDPFKNPNPIINTKGT